MQQDDILDAERAAAFVGLCRRAFEKWRRSDVPPPSFLIGKRHFYSKESLAVWNEAVKDRRRPRTKRAGSPGVS